MRISGLCGRLLLVNRKLLEKENGMGAVTGCYESRERGFYMEFEKVLTHRVSTRSYNKQVPDAETIQKIIDAALLSPIVRWHKLHLTVVTNKKAMALAEEAACEFVKAETRRTFMHGAPVWIIVSGIRHSDEDPWTAEWKNDNLFWNVGSIIENMELQATALGLASCGMNYTIVSIKNKPEVRKAVGIPDGYDALASVVIGYSDDDIPERKVNPELIPVSYVR